MTSSVILTSIHADVVWHLHLCMPIRDHSSIIPRFTDSVQPSLVLAAHVEHSHPHSRPAGNINAACHSLQVWTDGCTRCPVSGTLVLQQVTW